MFIYKIKNQVNLCICLSIRTANIPNYTNFIITIGEHVPEQEQVFNDQQQIFGYVWIVSPRSFIDKSFLNDARSVDCVHVGKVDCAN